MTISQNEYLIRMTWPMYRRQQIAVGDRLYGLSPQQTEIMFVLLSRHGYVSKNDLIEAVWPDPELEPDTASAVITTQVCLLRKRAGIEISHERYGFYILGEKHRA